VHDDVFSIAFVDGAGGCPWCVVFCPGFFVAVRFDDGRGDRRTTGALEANLYSEGSATVSAIAGATTGAIQEGFIGFGDVLNVPQYIPNCGCMPALYIHQWGKYDLRKEALNTGPYLRFLITFGHTLHIVMTFSDVGRKFVTLRV
jgi:hypothetical protein